MHVLPKKNIYPRPPTVGLGQVVLLEAIFIGAEPVILDSPIPSLRAQRLDAVPHFLQPTFERFIPRNDLRHHSMLHDYMNFWTISACFDIV